MKPLRFAMAALLAVPLAAVAAPKAESALECGIAADMAIVARSLAQESIGRPQANAIMARIYDVGASERGQKLMRDILDAAYVNTESSQAFAETLFKTCMRSGGDMNTVLGTRL